MNLEEIQGHMKTLRLHGMAESLEGMLMAGQSGQLNVEQMLAALIQAELDDREDRKTERLKKTARFRYTATMEQIRPSAERGLDAATLARLTAPRWLRHAENVIITGPTGVGKSYLASAIGHHACQLGFKTLYYNAQKLFEELKLTRLDGTHRKLMARLAKSDLLIIDDFGIHRLEEPQRLDLMEIVEDRHGLKSTLIAGQMPVAHWHEIIGEATLADAILDRLIHSAHRVQLAGKSLRKNTNKNN